MFIERGTGKRFSFAPAERKHKSDLPANVVNIALRWSASFRVQSIFYKHLVPLERNASLLFCAGLDLGHFYPRVYLSRFNCFQIMEGHQTP
jgi:hypothetical protein